MDDAAFARQITRDSWAAAEVTAEHVERARRLMGVGLEVADIAQWLAEVQRLLKLDGNDDHPENRCGRCGGRNLHNWYADSDVWNRVAGDFSILCPICFSELAQELGVAPTAWRLSIEGDDPEISKLRTALHRRLEEAAKLHNENTRLAARAKGRAATIRRLLQWQMIDETEKGDLGAAVANRCAKRLCSPKSDNDGGGVMYVDFVETLPDGKQVSHAVRNLPESPQVDDRVPVPIDDKQTGGRKLAACRVVAREWKTITDSRPCLICHVARIFNPEALEPDDGEET